MAPHTFSLSALTLLLFLTLQSHAATPSAPAPGPAGPINITAILEDGSQFTRFIRFLTENEISNQINNQVNTSTDGMTVFAPTDNAFANLPAGTLNKLTDRQQIQLIQYHILPKYYDLTSLLTVSNPVRTLSSGQDDGVYGLNFTGQATQVNVSTGIVDTLINNPLRQKKPLAVYQVDKVLLPAEFYVAKPPAASPPAKSKGKGEVEAAPAPKPTKEKPSDDSSESGRMNVGFGLVGCVWLFCMGMLS
ncbi:Fasciclin-like arabinogalactan protein 9 [Heracleum sosnowskyi]|uniref:Fasciclin-like arabinogalactan protein 9 n=1 Tax=Heracleum sosnowskyi TaxID=360622 RepID=A0AAD8JKD9_9APIA|nr:Fasciclin-like arabinogalactan protein 9 [Heracleum sosnowskyi]